MSIYSLLSELATEKIERTIKEAVSPLPFYLRKLATGTVIVTLSVFGFSLTLLFWAIALFLRISHYPILASAALWTSLFTFILGILFLTLGVSLLKKPRD